MKNIFWFSVVTLITLQSYGQVNFKPLSWKNAKEQAATQNKFLFVDCYTEWCGPCKLMANETFKDSVVGEFMNEHFVSLAEDMEKGEGPKIALKYRVSAFPTYLVFRPDGKLVYRAVGHYYASDFINLLNEALDPEKQTTCNGITDLFDLPFPEFAVNWAVNRVRPDSATVLSYLGQQDDLFNEVNWTVLSMVGIFYSKYRALIFDNKAKLIDLYGKQEVDMITEIGVRIAIKNKNEEDLSMILHFLDGDPNPQTPLLKTRYSIEYYTAMGEYNKTMDLLDELAAGENGYALHAFINDACWEIYEKCDDQQLVKRAVRHMAKAAFMEEDNYMELDTYAALLYKDQQYVLAEQIATRAIACGKKRNEDVSITQELLEKIQKANSGMAPAQNLPGFK